MEKIGLIYGSDTGKTEEITHSFVYQWKMSEVEVIEVTEVTKDDFARFDILILGLSTWYDGDLQSDWEDYYDEFKTIDFTGKTVAIFGLGDQYGYADYFVDGVGMLAEVVLENGGEIVGYWPVKGYDFSHSKGQANKTHFYGLALDEDNHPELTPKRLEGWIKLLEEELK